MEVPEEVQAWVTKLGGMSKEDIADLLRAEGVKGLTGAPNACPIANLIHKKTGTRVLMGHTVYSVDDTDTACARVPVTVGDFIDMFDSDEYPELEDVSDDEGWPAASNNVSKLINYAKNNGDYVITEANA